MGWAEDFLGYLNQQGGQVISQVMAPQPITQSGQTYGSTPAAVPQPAVQSPAPQQIQFNPVGAVTGFIGGMSSYAGQGIQNISSGFQQTFVQPVQNFIQPFQSISQTNPIQAMQMGAIGGIQNFTNPRQQIQAPAVNQSFNQSFNQTLPVLQGMTLFVPYGGQAQTQVNNLNAIVYDPVGGGFIGTQVPYGHSISNIVTSGSTGSLQSGMFSTKPLTPVVYTQESAGTVYSAAAVPAAAALVLASPASYSRMGAEAYGGYVAPLDARTIQSTGAQMGVYPASSGNLANLVDPYGVNQPKSAWTEMPWNTPVMATPGIYSLGTSGIMTPISSQGMASIGMAASAMLAALPGVGYTKGAGGAWNPFVVSAAAPIGYISEGWQMPSKGKDTYAYRNDPLAIWLEGAVQFGDEVIASGPSKLTGGLIPAWTPGADLLTRYGQNANPVYDTFTSNLAAVEAQKPQMDQLGSQIKAEQSSVNAMLSGKLNAQGQFTGTAQEYSQYQEARGKLNQDTATYNQYGEKVKGVIQSGFASGAIIPAGNGGYQPNPDLAKKYGAFSEWSADTNRFLRGGTTEAQIAAYEQSPAFKNAGAFTWFGEGSWKVLTNPVSMANSALLGVEVYAGMGVIGAGFAAMAPAATVEGVAVAPVGISQTIGAAGLRTMASPIFQYGTGAAFLGAGVWSSTEGFTAPAERSVSNLGGMTIHLAAMTGGALAPEGLARGFNYGTVRFAEKPMVVQTETNVFEYSQRPDVKVASGVGGEMKLTSTQTIASQPSISVFGKEIAFPRIFEPKLRGETVTTTDLRYGDVGSLLESRLGGTRAEPLFGQRVETMRVESFRGQELSHGTGDVRLAEVRLPRTIDEYVKMGAVDQKLIGLSQEEITAALMQNAADVTPATTGYRTLDAYAPRGTPVREFFDWTGNVQGGQSVEFNRINLEEFFGSMRVSQTGNARSAYEINVVRDVTEQGFMESGNYEVTGSQVPEAKIVSKLQEVSKGIQVGQNEVAYGFDSRGRLVGEILGNPHEVQGFPLKQQIITEPGTSGSFAHIHPSQPHISVFESLKMDLFGAKGLGIKPDYTFSKTRFAIKVNAQNPGAMSLPSRMPGEQAGDVYVMSLHGQLRSYGIEGKVNADYIISKEGVRIFRPDATRGWDIYTDLQNAPPVTDMPGSTRVQRAERVFGDLGIDTTFVKPNEAYRPTGYNERIGDVTGEMQAAYPEGVRNQFVDMVDRMTMKNPNMEFVREPGMILGGGEPSLLESGSNLGGGGVGYASPMSTMQAGVQQAESPFRQTIVEPARGQRVVFGGTERAIAGTPQQVFTTPTVMETPASSSRLLIAPGTIGATEFARAFTQSPGVISVSAAAQTQPQSIGQRAGIDVVRAMAMGSDVIQTPRQAQQQDYVRALAMGSDITQGLRQAQPQDYVRAVIFDQAQTPWQEPRQGQRQTPWQVPALVTPQIPIVPQIQKPWQERPPIPPVPLVPWFPLFPSTPGSGGGGGGRKRRGAFIETFGMGLDYSLKHPSKRQGKLWTSPKKKPASKKGGKKK